MYEPTFGPWVGVPRSKQRMCAVEGCAHEGVESRCLYDGSTHHHGCIHYECQVAEQTHHGLTFRDGWGLLCPSHYRHLEQALIRYRQTDIVRRLVAAE
jgi:hypothetical protein